MTRLDNLWARQGSPRPAWRTPREHFAWIPSDQTPTFNVDLTQKIIDCSYQVAFAGTPLQPEQRQDLQEVSRKLDSNQHPEGGLETKGGLS